jgi:hypothetical protein
MTTRSIAHTPWFYTPATIIITGCLVAIVNAGIRSSLGFFTARFPKRTPGCAKSIPLPWRTIEQDETFLDDLAKQLERFALCAILKRSVVDVPEGALFLRTTIMAEEAEVQIRQCWQHSSREAANSLFLQINS